MLVEHDVILAHAVEEMQRITKTKALYMVAAAICHRLTIKQDELELFGKVERFTETLIVKLAPEDPDEIWNKGAVFKRAMATALEVVLR
jgi:hypothetical protein